MFPLGGKYISLFISTSVFGSHYKMYFKYCFIVILMLENKQNKDLQDNFNKLTWTQRNIYPLFMTAGLNTLSRVIQPIWKHKLGYESMLLKVLPILKSSKGSEIHKNIYLGFVWRLSRGFHLVKHKPRSITESLLCCKDHCQLRVIQECKALGSTTLVSGHPFLAPYSKA